MRVTLRKRPRTFATVIAIVGLLAGTLGVAAVGLPSTTPAAFQFEFDDNATTLNGVLTDDADTDGGLDWDDTNEDGSDRLGTGVIEAVRNADGTCTQTNLPATAGTPSTAGAGLLVCDGSAGNFADRDIFTGGSKNEGTDWDITGGSNPKKGDFADLMLYAKFGDSTFDADSDPDDLFIFAGYTRLDVNGSTHLDVELNKFDVKRNCTDTDPGPIVEISNCTPQRTIGDILIAEDLERGGIPQLRVFVFKNPVGTETCENAPQVTPPCFVLDPTPSPQAAAAVINTLQGTEADPFIGEIQGPGWDAVGCERTSDDNSPGCRIRDDIPAKGWVESFVDLSAFGIDVTCPGFSNVVFKTRASNELNSELKDDSEKQISISKCSLAWEKRDGSTTAPHALQGGATFTVGGATAGPFACLDADNTGPDDANPVTIVDNGSNDSDADAGQLLLDNICFGTYTVTETVAPSGFAKDSTTTRTATVNASTPNATIGTQGVDDEGATGDFHNRLGSIGWEKRDQTQVVPSTTTHILQGGATFTVGRGATPANGDGNGPFACQDTNNTGSDDDNPVTVVDGSAPDADTDAGQLQLNRVCLGTYTITETVAPTGYLKDRDTTRTITVSESSLNATVGSALGAPPSTDDEGTRDATTAECTNNACDYHNFKGSILIRKEAKDANTQATNDLLGGATFKITPDPVDGIGDLTVTDNGAGDANSTAGLICIDNALQRSDYSIQETAAPTGYAFSTTAQTNKSSSSKSCAEQATSPTVSATFENTPLSTIRVQFSSLAGAGVTRASIVCSDGTSTVPAVSENGGADVLTITSNTAANPTVITTSAAHGLTSGAVVQVTGSNSTPSINGTWIVTVIDADEFSIPANVTGAGSAGTVLPLDDSNELFGDGTTSLVPGTYTCTVVIDP